MNIKYKNIPKMDLKEGQIGKWFKVKLKWGYGTIYIYQNKNKTFDYEIYWTDTDTGSDNTVEMEKNQKWEDGSFDDIAYHCLSLLGDYFEEHTYRIKIEQNINILEDLRGTY